MHTLTGTGSRHRSIEILMARFDVYANRRGGAFLLDVQTDLITGSAQELTWRFFLWTLCRQ